MVERGEDGRARPGDSPTRAAPLAARLARSKLRSHVPRPVRNSIRRGTWAYRIATSPQRVLPDLIIIGAQRSGTSSLYSYLIANPAIERSHVKEVHYFDSHFQRGILWYRAHFPMARHLESLARALGSKTIATEASPYYLSHPLAPHRVRGVLPQVKLVVLLRDPVDRALSHYHLSVRKGTERLSIEDAIEREPERLAGEHERLLAVPLSNSAGHRRHGYVARGQYAEQLERWLSVFPRDQLLILNTAGLFDDPNRVLRRICEFAGVVHRPMPSYNVRPSRTYPDYSAVRARLREHFAPHNERLWELIGERFEWE